MKTLISILFLSVLFNNAFADTITEPIRTFTGHTGNVDINSVAFSPDGKTALSGGDSIWGIAEIKLWNVTTGEEIRSFSGHSDGVSSVAYSPDGKTVLSGSYDGTMKLWNVTTGEEVRSFWHYSRDVLKSVFSVAYSPDGKTVLSGSIDKTMKLWNVTTGEEIRTFSGHSDAVKSVTYSPDGKTVLSGSVDKTMKLWNVTTGEEIRSFSGHIGGGYGGVKSVAYSPDGKTALSGGSYDTQKFTTESSAILESEGAMKLWDVTTGEEIHSFSGHTQTGGEGYNHGNVNSVAFSPDGRYALSGADDETLKLWDVNSGSEIRSFSGNFGPPGTRLLEVMSVAFSPDGRYALSGSRSAKLELWDTGLSPPSPPANVPPTAAFSISTTHGEAPLTVNLDGSQSNDADGNITEHAWTTSDGQQTSGGNQQITFANAGTYTITLTVTDNDGLTGQTQQTVTVTQQNLVPDIRIEPTTLRFDNAQRSRRGFKHANDSLILKESIVGNEFLFITTDSQPDAKISQPTITRLKYVDINPIALSQEAENKIVYTEKVILNLFPDVTYIATNTAINYHSKGHYTWIGKIENLKFGDVTLVVKNGKITGNINANGTVYRIRPMKNGHHAIQQIDASAFPQYEPTSSLKPKLTKYDSMTSRQRRKTRKDDGSTIDVMVVYTSSAADASSDIESEIELAIAETNQAYANSDIQQRLRLVHTEQIDYTETGSFGTDLDRLESTSDDHIDNVHDLRDTHRADLVSFWVEGGDYCGLAPLMTNDTIVISFASHGFSVVARDCATAPQYSFGHELGHNMGAHHDSHVTGAHGAYDYSHGYVRATGDSSNSWRTILAYPNECSDNGHICGRIQYFSNPSILYDNNATGSDSANNRTTLNNTAAVIAAFRQSLNLPTKEETKSFSIHNEGNADLIVSSISMEGSASWISISPTSATVYRGSPVAIKVQVNYLSAPIGESTTRLLIHSNDPDENPYPMDIVVNRHSDTAGDKRELKDAVYAQNTGELSLAIEVPDATGQMEVSNATLKLVNSALVFQLNNISSLASKPPGDISSYDPRTTNVNIPIVNVPDTQGKPQLFKVTMQPVPSGIDQVFWFQVTEAIRIEVPIVE